MPRKTNHKLSEADNLLTKKKERQRNETKISSHNTKKKMYAARTL